MKIAGIYKNSLTNGPGMRFVLFTQGCKHHCEGCHNPTTWNFDSGMDMSIEEIIESIRENQHIISGITISGGDPFEQKLELLELCIAIKTSFPKLSILIYTGYTYEELLMDKTNTDILIYTDILIDGKFEKDLTEKAHKFTGSNNQRVIHLFNGDVTNIE